MDKDVIVSISAIFDEDTQEGIENMKNAFLINKFKQFSQFKQYFQNKYKNTQCHHCWLQSTYGILIDETKDMCSQIPQPICLNCFINSQTYKNLKSENANFNSNIRIVSFLTGRCKCGSSNSTIPFHCLKHSQQKQEEDSDFLVYKETLQNVVALTFSKFDTVLKMKRFTFLANNNDSIIDFIKELAEINEIFLGEVGRAILTQKAEIRKLLLDSYHFPINTNLKLCELFNLLLIEPSFSNEFYQILLNLSQTIVSDCFKFVSIKSKDNNSKDNNVFLIRLFDFPTDFSIYLLTEQGYQFIEFSRDFISHFQKILLKTKFLNSSQYPFLYLKIFRILRTQFEYISRSDDQEMNGWIQTFFDSIYESLNELDSDFNTKFMEYSEGDKYNKLIYLYKFTYDIAKLFISKDENEYQIDIDIDGLIETVFYALDYNFISANLFDNSNENKNKNKEEEEKNDDDDENDDDSVLKKSIRSENVNVALFNQLIHFFSFFIVSLPYPVVNLRDYLEPNILLYGSIIPARLLSWNFSYKMNLGSTLNEGGDNFFKEFNIGRKSKYFFFGNFGFIQIASLLLEGENREKLVNLIASSLGIYEKNTINNNLNEYLPTLKLCFIFFIGCLYFDRYTSLKAKIGEFEREDSIRMIRMIHRLKKGTVNLNELYRSEFETIEKVAYRRKTANDQTIYCLKKKEQLPINWNPFYVINPINEVISLLANEIPSKGLFILPSVEDELNGMEKEIEDQKLAGVEFHHILMTPTVYSIIYSILSDFFIEKQKNIESIHLSLNLLLIIIHHATPTTSNIENKTESFTAENLRQLTDLFKNCTFEEFAVKKVNFGERGENSLFDLLVKIKGIGEPVVKNIKKKFPSLIEEEEKEAEIENKAPSSQRAKELKRTISEKFQSQINLFKSQSLSTELFEEEEDQDESNGACQICHSLKENEGLCYMVYIYKTTLPSLYEPYKDGRPREVLQFSICNHLFHRNCAFQETGVPPKDSEFKCPIDRTNKNAIMPKIEGYGELDDTTNLELNVFLMDLNASFEKLIVSFTSIFVLNEVRYRLTEIQDQIKYSSQILLAKNLYFILWHSIHSFEKVVNKSGMTLFQRFVSSFLTHNFKNNLVKFRKLVEKYSERVEGQEKSLFLRRCRVFEFFILEEENSENLEIDELANNKLWDHFGLQKNDDKKDIVEYSFLCDQFKKYLPLSFIELCNNLVDVSYNDVVSAFNVFNGQILGSKRRSSLALLLDALFNDEEQNQFNVYGQNKQIFKQPSIAIDDDFNSEDSDTIFCIVESLYDEQNLSNTETNNNENDNNNNDNKNDNDNDNDQSSITSGNGNSPDRNDVESSATSNEASSNSNDTKPPTTNNIGTNTTPNANINTAPNASNNTTPNENINTAPNANVNAAPNTSTNATQNVNAKNNSSNVSRRKQSILPPTTNQNSPILLMMTGKENSMVIIVYEKKFVQLKSFYVDSDGEPDVGFKREQMLFFNEKNYEHACDSLLSGDFTMKLETIYF